MTTTITDLSTKQLAAAIEHLTGAAPGKLSTKASGIKRLRREMGARMVVELELLEQLGHFNSALSTPLGGDDAPAATNVEQAKSTRVFKDSGRRTHVRKSADADVDVVEALSALGGVGGTADVRVALADAWRDDDRKTFANRVHYSLNRLIAAGRVRVADDGKTSKRTYQLVVV